MGERSGGLLEGVKVLDLSAVVMGPYAGQILGDLGADVVKVEPPGGDSTRHTGPRRAPGMAALYLGVNRNKRGIVLDLKRPAAQRALGRLAETADVLIHSMRPHKLAGVGVSADAFRRRNPRLIFAGLYGFGEGGPYAGLPAYDDTIQGMSGFADLTARQTGEPRYLPTIAADKTSGLIAANAILAALVKRDRTGVGCEIEVPMYEAMVAFNLVEHMYGRHFDFADGEIGYPRVLAEWRKPYRTSDGHVCLMPYTDRHWQAFFAEVGDADAAGDVRFADIAARTTHIDQLYALAGRHIARRPTGAWLAACDRLGIPAAKIAGLADLLADEHLRATGFFATIDGPDGGPLYFPGIPYRFDGERPPISRPPALGEHTLEVLTEAGVDEQTIEELAR